MSIGLSEESEKKHENRIQNRYSNNNSNKNMIRTRKNKVSFLDQARPSLKLHLYGGLNKSVDKNSFMRKNQGVIREQQVRDRILVKNLQKWDKIIMLPDEDIESAEVVRPFVIMQPKYIVHGDKKIPSKKGQNFNPRCDPPNSIEFFKEWNKCALEKYPGKLPSSRALTSEMQKKGAVYLNVKDDQDYKSLYGEKDPNYEGSLVKDKDFYM